jgi:hypothetical protein
LSSPNLDVSLEISSFSKAGASGSLFVIVGFPPAAGGGDLGAILEEATSAAGLACVDGSSDRLLDLDAIMVYQMVFLVSLTRGSVAQKQSVRMKIMISCIGMKKKCRIEYRAQSLSKMTMVVLIIICNFR